MGLQTLNWNTSQKLRVQVSSNILQAEQKQELLRKYKIQHGIQTVDISESYSNYISLLLLLLLYLPHISPFNSISVVAFREFCRSCRSCYPLPPIVSWRSLYATHSVAIEGVAGAVLVDVEQSLSFTIKNTKSNFSLHT